MSYIVITLAGLMGASGVILLAAVAAHVSPSTGLDSVAYMLLFHAAAILAGTSILHQGLLWRPLATVALAAWVLGSILFCGDIAHPALAGHRLFPMAAPSGGALLIGGWFACGCGRVCRDGALAVVMCQSAVVWFAFRSYSCGGRDTGTIGRRTRRDRASCRVLACSPLEAFDQAAGFGGWERGEVTVESG
jgi:uncharacterized membrane protein YgdD (TMEM256/DUF423 family)